MTTFADLEREIPLGGRITLVALDGQSLLEADYMPDTGWTISDIDASIPGTYDIDAQSYALGYVRWLRRTGAIESGAEIMILGEVQS